MTRLNASCWMPWRLTSWPLPWQPWPRSNARMLHFSGNCNCGWSACATTLSEHDDSTVPSNPRTAWWRGHSRRSGRTSCEASTKLEREYENWRRRQRLTLTDEDRDQILALAQDLPRVWSAPTTTAADRKQLLGLLIDSVLLDNHRLVGRTWFQINWGTGAT